MTKEDKIGWIVCWLGKAETSLANAAAYCDGLGDASRTKRLAAMAIEVAAIEEEIQALSNSKHG